jgi:hypothetical protein
MVIRTLDPRLDNRGVPRRLRTTMH